jgi:hypothetical protein
MHAPEHEGRAQGFRNRCLDGDRTPSVTTHSFYESSATAAALSLLKLPERETLNFFSILLV